MSRKSQKPSRCGRKYEQGKYKNQWLWEIQTSYSFRNLGKEKQGGIVGSSAFQLNLEKQNKTGFFFNCFTFHTKNHYESKTMMFYNSKNLIQPRKNVLIELNMPKMLLFMLKKERKADI